MKNKAILKHFLDKTIYLLSYILMVVSFLYVLIPLFFNIELDSNRWANFGGFSIVTSLLFIRIFYFGDYCSLTRYLPFALLFINIVNIIAAFFPEKYNVYSKWYEIIIFSVILIVGFFVYINKKIR